MPNPSLAAMVVDADVPRSADRKVVEVAVGVLINSNQQYLMTTRPEGKVYAGYWEFPGGKLEAGESVLTALRRELMEEIGVTIADATLCCDQIVDYPHAVVRLNFCTVTQWSGALTMREGQRYQWSALPVSIAPVLPGAKPILAWLGER